MTPIYLLLMLAFTIRRSPVWIQYSQPPSDPAKSCYERMDDKNKTVWICCDDSDLNRYIDGDDSY